MYICPFKVATANSSGIHKSDLIRPHIFYIVCARSALTKNQLENPKKTQIFCACRSTQRMQPNVEKEKNHLYRIHFLLVYAHCMLFFLVRVCMYSVRNFCMRYSRYSTHSCYTLVRLQCGMH